MNRPQARTSDILNHRSYCVFSRYGTNPFKFEPCRDSCDGLNQVCGNYIPSHNSRQTKPTIPLRPKGFEPQSTTDDDLLAIRMDKTADTYSQQTKQSSSITPELVIDGVSRLRLNKTADTFEILDVLEDGTDPNQYILMMARVNKTNGRKFLYKDLQDWIRKNDRSAI